jgi:hypothetical protein
LGSYNNGGISLKNSISSLWQTEKVINPLEILPKEPINSILTLIGPA